MKRGYLARDEDISTVTGTGNVANFCINDDGQTVIFWDVGVGVWPSLEAAQKVHGHNGKTRFVILDDPEARAIPHCVLCHDESNHPCPTHLSSACPGCLETV